MILSSFNQPFVIGTVETPTGKVPQVSSYTGLREYLAVFKARLKMGSMKNTVAPGLYALGKPGSQSHVLVFANYKMSFDRLRKAMRSRNVWILVLDAGGLDIWCAACKGIFCTEELVGCIDSCGLTLVVNHWQLILPQLAAPGIAAHRVRRLSGFEVFYGPIRTEDLPAFLDAGLKATSLMRQKRMRPGSTLQQEITLKLDHERCVGCGMCLMVCPHPVLKLRDGLPWIEDSDACIKCGACVKNCPGGAFSV